MARSIKSTSGATCSALGAVLCVILTGQPPFVGETAESTRQLAALKKLDDAFARLDACAAEPELVSLCKCCLAPERADRPWNAGELAVAVHAIRAAADERARKAEVERVRAEDELRIAELKVIEQRKRRRVQLALASAVLLLLVGGGAFAWWHDKQAAQRDTEILQRQIEDERLAGEKREREGRNRDAFVASLDRCEMALREGDAYRAGLAQTETQKRQSEGGTEGFTGRAERCRVDLAMLQELDRIDNFRWTSVNGIVPDYSVVAAQWQQVFAAFGIVPGTTTLAEATRRLGESLIRERLLTGLDLWLVMGEQPGLMEILAAADPDAYRNALRVAIGTRNEWLVQALAFHTAVRWSSRHGSPWCWGSFPALRWSGGGCCWGRW